MHTSGLCHPRGIRVAAGLSDPRNGLGHFRNGVRAHPRMPATPEASGAATATTLEERVGELQATVSSLTTQLQQQSATRGCAAAPPHIGG